MSYREALVFEGEGFGKEWSSYVDELADILYLSVILIDYCGKIRCSICIPAYCVHYRRAANAVCKIVKCGGHNPLHSRNESALHLFFDGLREFRVSVSKGKNVGCSLNVVAAHERIIEQVSNLCVDILGIGQIHSVSRAVGIAETLIEIPNRACYQLAVKILVEEGARQADIPVTRPLLNKICSRKGCYVDIIRHFFAKIVISVAAV